MRIKLLFIIVVGISLLFSSCQKNDFIENMDVSEKTQIMIEKRRKTYNELQDGLMKHRLILLGVPPKYIDLVLTCEEFKNENDEVEKSMKVSFRTVREILKNLHDGLVSKEYIKKYIGDYHD